MIKEKILLDKFDDYDLYLLKLSANTKDTESMIVTLDTWFKYQYNKPKMINGKSYESVVARYLVDYKNREYFLKQSIYYNKAGAAIGEQPEDNIVIYSTPVPGSMGEYLIEQAILDYEMVLALEHMQQEN